MTINSAYVLVFHGSRDVRAQRGSEELTKLVKMSLNRLLCVFQRNTGGTLLLSKPPLVEAADLELAEVSLSERIYQLGLIAIAEGIEKINIIPMLLATGVHVQVDIPTAVAEAQNQLGTKINLNICSHLGNYQGIVELVQQEYPSLPDQGKILLAHGSRLQTANQEVEKLAQKVGAIAAYSFISPNLETQVEKLIREGKELITIVPYVLFEGKITEAIATQIQRLEQQFPNINFSIGKPLGANQNLAKLITNILQKV